jgi:hypothetical protein
VYVMTAHRYVTMVFAPNARPRISAGKSSDVSNKVSGPNDMEYPDTTRAHRAGKVKAVPSSSTAASPFCCVSIRPSK